MTYEHEFLDTCHYFGLMKFPIYSCVGSSCSFSHEGINQCLELFGSKSVQRKPLSRTEHNVERTTTFAETSVGYFVQPGEEYIWWKYNNLKPNKELYSIQLRKACLSLHRPHISNFIKITWVYSPSAPTLMTRLR